MSRQLHASVALPRYPLYRRLGGPQSRPGCSGEEKNLFPLPGIESRLLGRPAPMLCAIPAELSRHSKIYILG
jgi:hypothetical protein